MKRFGEGKRFVQARGCPWFSIRFQADGHPNPASDPER
jgi:hypothetical protein